jgi:hypothetical protein
VQSREQNKGANLSAVAAPIKILLLLRRTSARAHCFKSATHIILYSLHRETSKLIIALRRTRNLDGNYSSAFTSQSCYARIARWCISFEFYHSIIFRYLIIRLGIFRQFFYPKYMTFLDDFQVNLDDILDGFPHLDDF